MIARAEPTIAKEGPAARVSRTAWVDIARGIGIILVVFGHALRAIYPSLSNAPVWARTTDGLIYSFHMPMFFLLSGLFAWRSLQGGRSRFFNDKLRTIVYPYFLWSLIEGGLEIVMGSKVNTPVTPHDLMMTPVAPIEQYWFLYVLFFCQMVALVFYPRKALLIVVTLVGIVFSMAVTTGLMPLRTFVSLPYFAVGILGSAMLLRLGEERIRAIGFGLVGLLVWVAGLLMPASLPAMLIAGIGGTFLACAIAMLAAGRIGSGTLALLGRASMAIYLMHTIFSAAARIFLKMAGVQVDVATLLVLTTAIGLVAPLAAWWVAEQWGLGTWLGFGDSRRTPGGLGSNGWRFPGTGFLARFRRT